MQTIIGMVILALVGVMFVIQQYETECEKKAREAEGWIRC